MLYHYLAQPAKINKPMSNPNPTIKLPAGPGRPKGSQSKITASAKEAIQLAFEGMGGVRALIEWARDTRNRGIFYSQIWPKILPHEITGPGGNTLVIKLLPGDETI
jgi:hypothetical protein